MSDERQAKILEAREEIERLVGRIPRYGLHRRMEAVAAQAVEACGVRDNLLEYPVPEEFLPWRECYLACLWKAAWKKRGAAAGRLTTRAVALLAEQYRRNPAAQVRYAILLAARERAGKAGVEALAHCLGVDPDEAWAAAESWSKLKNQIRRRQVPTVPCLPPDTSPWRDAREVAEAECGFGGTVRYSRRDTHSVTNALEGRARRL